MADRSIDIGSSFELLSQEEWDKYLSTALFDGMCINAECFKKYEQQIFMYLPLGEAIHGHNNKVDDLRITYALCKHYFDKGIPDDPWYISPGKDGCSIQYMPNFKNEHWMRRYWFNHYSENLYLKYFSLWDGIIGLLNIFYEINESLQDYRFRSKVMGELKKKQKPVFDFLSAILDDPIYKEANQYRTSFVHGIAPSVVSDGYVLEKDKLTETVEMVNGTPQKRQVRSQLVLSCRAGNYTYIGTVMNNAESFATFTGQKIQELIKLIA